MPRKFARYRALIFGALLGCLASQPAVSGLVRDAEIEETLRLIADPILTAAGMDPKDIEIYLVGDKNFNAFVAGGRNIFLNTGLIQQLETPEELAAVIAHEAAHITGGHLARKQLALRAAQRESIIALIAGLGAAVASGGSAGPGFIMAGQQAVERNFLKYSRSEEASADQASVDFLLRAGIDPRAALLVLERLQKQEKWTMGTGIDPYALSHPIGQDRVSLLISKVGQAPRQSGFGVDIQQRYQRARAKLDGFTNDPALVITEFGTRSDFLALYRLAPAYHRLPNPDQALKITEQLLRMEPQNPYLWELKGQILAESGRGAEAIAPYRQAVKLRPDSSLLSAGLGQAMLSVDDSRLNQEAVQILEHAAAQDLYDPGVRRGLAIAYARLGNEPMAALVTAERLALQGKLVDAQIHARRAEAGLPPGSPTWLRAQDILAVPPPKQE